MHTYPAVITKTENYTNNNGVNFIDGTLEIMSNAETFNDFTQEELIKFADFALLELKRVIITLESDEDTLSQENPIHALRLLRTRVHQNPQNDFFNSEDDNTENLPNPYYCFNFDVLKVSLNQKNNKFYSPVATIRVPLVSVEDGKVIENYSKSEEEIVTVLKDNIISLMEKFYAA